MIEFYDFGVIIIDGKKFTIDIIVLQERIIEGWWRKEGHKICVEDLREVFDCKPKPEILVVGTGYHGMVTILPEVKNALKSQGMTLIAQPTKDACARAQNVWLVPST